MLHPVGDHAPSVYWRRRLLLLALLVLAAVSIYALAFRGGGDGAPRSNGPVIPTTGSPRTGGPGSPSTGSPTGTTGPVTASGSTSPASAVQSPAPRACAPSQLAIAASASQPRYPAGARPSVAIVVINRGQLPCVADLSDSQIELRIYNGSARVWGSHDCAIQPGSALATLPVGQPIRRDIEWSGLTSQPACAGTRTRVGAGTYTVQAFLGGRQGTPATFVLAG